MGFSPRAATLPDSGKITQRLARSCAAAEPAPAAACQALRGATDWCRKHVRPLASGRMAERRAHSFAAARPGLAPASARPRRGSAAGFSPRPAAATASGKIVEHLARSSATAPAGLAPVFALRAPGSATALSHRPATSTVNGKIAERHAAVVLLARTRPEAARRAPEHPATTAMPAREPIPARVARASAATR
jgi:hypothetical protein